MTQMMEQYLQVKDQYRGYILFYRLGDFYEMFFDDALIASRELDLTLTGRDCGEPKRAPMCGVPFHSAETYIGKLIEKGYKVAICEQMEDPATAKGLVKREVIREITPGTVVESDLLSETRNNYLCAVCVGGERTGVCFADVSTGQITATSVENGDAYASLIGELGTYAPREILLNAGADECAEVVRFAKERLSALIEDGERERFEEKNALDALAVRYGSEFASRYASDGEMLRAVGALLSYVIETQRTDVSYLQEIEVYGQGQYMDLDLNTRRNLELCETMRTKEKRGSLVWVLDKTKTAMGARLLRQYVEHPLLDVARITARQEAVGELHDDFRVREEVSVLLENVLDLERLMTKIVYGTANGKDLIAVANTLAVIPEVKAAMASVKSRELAALSRGLDDLTDVVSRIRDTVTENPPFSIREGGIIRDGFHAGVDELRSIMRDGKGWIERVEADEREKTGIKTLKIGYNRVFGYYIEVSNSFKDQVPEGYIRKQTLSNCERYITDELKRMESTILGAADKVAGLEYELFTDLRTYVGANGKRIRESASKLAKLDVYVSLSDVAARNNYVCPEVDYSDALTIRDGRHPVVEQFVKDSYFVPNDTDLDTANNRFMLITGPNMAGKSTYMRQSALIVLMAQIGSFVPAKSARIGIVDKLFTRVGASDDLSSGQSTFMLEMNEVSYILRNATNRSFIIYDEIGRGTSTYDGMSIARAIAEYTTKKIGARAMFATHYHELTDLESTLPGVVNYNIAAKKRGDDIIFLRKIVKGPTDDSYGIEVAKLAGLPNEVIRRARAVLAEIEGGTKTSAPAAKRTDETDGMTLSIEDMAERQIADRLRATDINTLTPIEAMNLIFELKKLQ